MGYSGTAWSHPLQRVRGRVEKLPHPLKDGQREGNVFWYSVLAENVEELVIEKEVKDKTAEGPDVGRGSPRQAQEKLGASPGAAAGPDGMASPGGFRVLVGNVVQVAEIDGLEELSITAPDLDGIHIDMGVHESILVQGAEGFEGGSGNLLDGWAGEPSSVLGAKGTSPVFIDGKIGVRHGNGIGQRKNEGCFGGVLAAKLHFLLYLQLPLRSDGVRDVE